MSEITVKRICKSGWKNCKMPELRQRIAELEQTSQYWKDEHIAGNKQVAELEAAYKHTVEDNEDLVRVLDALPDKLLKVRKADLSEAGRGKLAERDEMYCYGWRDASNHLKYIINKALQQENDDG